MSKYKAYFCQCVMSLIPTKQIRSSRPKVWMLEGWKIHRDALGIPESVVEVSARRLMDQAKSSEGSVGDWNNVLYCMAKEHLDTYQVDPAHNHIIKVKEKTSWQSGQYSGKSAAVKEEDSSNSNIIPLFGKRNKHHDT